MGSTLKDRLLAWGMLLFLALTWGSSFILMKRGLYDPEGQPVFTPQQVAALRISLTALILAPFALRELAQLRGKAFWPLVSVALFGNFFPAFLFPFAQQHIDSSLAGILNSMVPLFTLLLAVGFFRLRLRWFQVTGIVVGLLSAVGLIAWGGTVSLDGSYPYGFFVILATLGYGINANVIAEHLSDMHPITVNALAFWMLGIPVTGYLFMTDLPERIVTHEHGWASFGYIAILAVMGTAVAKIVFTRLVNQTSALFASSVTYLIPLVAVFWGVLDGEGLAGHHLIFGGAILTGVYLVNLRKVEQRQKQ